jgi:hypothetical protein
MWTFCERGSVERLQAIGYRLQGVEGFRRLGVSHGRRFKKRQAESKKRKELGNLSVSAVRKLSYRRGAEDAENS